MAPKQNASQDARRGGASERKSCRRRSARRPFGGGGRRRDPRRTRRDADGNRDGSAAAAEVVRSIAFRGRPSTTRRSRSARKTTRLLRAESRRARQQRCRRFPSRARLRSSRRARAIRRGDPDTDRFRQAGRTGRSRDESRSGGAKSRRRRPGPDHRRDRGLSARAAHLRPAPSYPREFAILQNNLATAFLSMPITDERGKMREALAVQAFEEGLKVVNR